MSDQVPVELHIVSDSTGETAARLVLALEAQFPDLVFEEVRHPRVESVEDLALAVSRARGRPAVMVYTLVAPALRARVTASARSSTDSTRGCRTSSNTRSGNCASSASTSRAAVSPVESDTMCSSTGTWSLIGGRLQPRFCRR